MLADWLTYDVGLHSLFLWRASGLMVHKPDLRQWTILSSPPLEEVTKVLLQGTCPAHSHALVQGQACLFLSKTGTVLVPQCLI
jgi:hypothetical protein